MIRAFIALLLVGMAQAQIANQLITPSANGHYLVNSTTSANAPVYLVGEDAFLLGTQLCLADMIFYLNDRQARGFNVVWFEAADGTYTTSPPANCNGDAPFTGGDFNTLNPPYWAYVDQVVAAASARGITLLFNPAFVGINSSQGWFTDFTGGVSGATFTTFGAALGNRYKNANNLIWVLGGDADIAGNATIKTNVGLLATAIAAADPNHILTIEDIRGTSSYNAYAGSPPSWVNLNWSYDQYANVVTGCRSTYAQSSTILPLEGEAWYELEHSMTALQLREQNYWATLSGCYLGILFGNGQIWPFSSPNPNTGNGTTPNWKTQLGSAGSVGEQYTGKLMRTREHWLMVPDTTNTYLPSGFGSGTTLSVLSRSSDGQTMIAYVPNGNAATITINMAGITSASSAAVAWWYNPQTAAPTLIGTFANTGTQNFTPPDANDWALVIDDASANLPPPGVSSSWGTIMAPTRAINWGTAGLPFALPDGEIASDPLSPPTGRTQCGSTISPSGDQVTGTDVVNIENAILACTAGHYVLLAAGTFYISNHGNCFGGSTSCLAFFNPATGTTPVNGVTLRGSGGSATILKMSTNSTITWTVSSLTGSCSWTGGYSPGSTSLTVSGCSGTALVAGQLVTLNQCDTGYSGAPCTTGSTADNGALWVCKIDPACAQQNIAGVRHMQRQQVLSTSSTGTGTLTIFSPGVLAPNWNSGNTPTVSWVSLQTYGDALEDLTVYAPAQSSQSYLVNVGTSYASWVKGVRFIGGTTNNGPLGLQGCKNVLIENNYFFSDPQLDGSFPPPVQTDTCSESAIVNNISAGSVFWEGNGGNEGIVLAYNYARDTFTAYMEDIEFDHTGGSLHQLEEGNEIGGMLDDNTWGTHDLDTRFRNYLPGWDMPYVQAHPRGIAIDDYQRFDNEVGNSIGSQYITTYQANADNVAFRFLSDPLTLASNLRWGNCDTATNTCRFQGSEIPNSTNMPAGTYPNATAYQNSTPGNSNLPCSFFLQGAAFTNSPCPLLPSGGTKLSWWKVCKTWTSFPTSCATTQTQPFPIAGPDIASGPYVNGTAYDNPAQIAWQNSPIDSSLQNSYGITGTAWSNVAGTCSPAPNPCEILTITALPNTTHLMGGFQLSGVNPACQTNATITGNNGANDEILMTGSSSTTVIYSLPVNPSVACTGTMKFPDVRQFDERVFQADSGGAAPTIDMTGTGVTWKGVTISQ